MRGLCPHSIDTNSAFLLRSGPAYRRRRVHRSPGPRGRLLRQDDGAAAHRRPASAGQPRHPRPRQDRRRRGDRQGLGVHMLADGAGNVIQAAVYAIKYGLTTTDLSETWSPYLTMAESLRLAAQTFTKDVSSCPAAPEAGHSARRRQWDPRATTRPPACSACSAFSPGLGCAAAYRCCSAPASRSARSAWWPAASCSSSRPSGLAWACCRRRCGSRAVEASDPWGPSGATRDTEHRSRTIDCSQRRVLLSAESGASGVDRAGWPYPTGRASPTGSPRGAGRWRSTLFGRDGKR